VQPSSTVEQQEQPRYEPSRSFKRAFRDIAGGWQQRSLWGHLGLQDIKQGYRRSVIGPLWITLSMAVTAIALGILYSMLFQMPLEQHLPYLTVGFIVWNFIAGCINDGATVFIANEGLIKHLPAPLSVHVYRLVWRQLLFFAHNLVVWVALVLIFPKPLSLSDLIAIPAIILLAVNGAWVAFLVGIFATRFRDIPPIIGSLVQLMFFMTPIVWNYDEVRNSGNSALAERAVLAEWNPFLHFVEIVRRPLLGETLIWRHWLVVLGITVVGWALALVAMRNYRARVSYWV